MNAALKASFPLLFIVNAIELHSEIKNLWLVLPPVNVSVIVSAKRSCLMQ